MATHLFHVKVTGIDENRVVLDLRIITGEQPEFPEGASFALMLLYDPIDSEMVHDAPLGRAVSFDQTMDAEWLDEHVDEYIVSSTLSHVSNLPITEDIVAMSPKQRRDFFASSRAPSASLEIVVTRPEWIRHLRQGMEWNTAAYDALL